MAEDLKKIDHIVVLMMENRSFDHMLGYLSHPREGARGDIDGLTGTESNPCRGSPQPVFHLPETNFTLDPRHDSKSVKEQLSEGNQGFVRNFARVDPNNPGRIMGYYNATDLPVYDFLAREFCVCDKWFSSVPGPTWPNRLYSMTGESDGDVDNPKLANTYGMKTIFNHLDDFEVDWRYFFHDFPFLLICRRSLLQLGHIRSIDEFYEGARTGRLPRVCWIDPNFQDFFKGGNDDHPPTDARRGQALVGRVYNALREGGNGLWESAVMVVTYDEHGGFYDHVEPPSARDKRPRFRRYGVRVPALVASPWVERGGVAHTVFDHTSILKTILLRYCILPGGIPPDMGLRVDSADHLGGLLSAASPRRDCPHAPELPEVVAPMVRGVPVTGSGPATDLQELISRHKKHLGAKGIRFRRVRGRLVVRRGTSRRRKKPQRR